MKKNLMTDESKRSIAQALRASTYAYAGSSSNTRPVITEETTMASDVSMIAEGVERIGNSDGKLFIARTDENHNAWVDISRLGHHLLNLLKINVGEIQDHFPLHTFDPRAQIFIKALDIYDFGHLLNLYPVLTAAEVMQFTALLNNFVAYLRKEVRAPSFGKMLSNLRRSARKAYKGLLRYLQSLIESRSKVLIVRIDLSYGKHANWPQCLESIDYGTVRGHKQELIKYLQKQLHDVMLGYVWKFEHGLEKSFHIHLTVVFDGHQVRGDTSLGELIGKQWAQVITEGRGMYWNCNRNKGGYSALGIGQICRDDLTARPGVLHIANYVTKPDYVLRLVVPPGHRSFGKGGPVKLNGARRGRPPQLPAFTPPSVSFWGPYA